MYIMYIVNNEYKLYTLPELSKSIDYIKLFNVINIDTTSPFDIISLYPNEKFFIHIYEDMSLEVFCNEINYSFKITFCIQNTCVYKYIIDNKLNTEFLFIYNNKNIIVIGEYDYIYKKRNDLAFLKDIVNECDEQQNKGFNSQNDSLTLHTSNPLEIDFKGIKILDIKEYLKPDYDLFQHQKENLTWMNYIENKVDKDPVLYARNKHLIKKFHPLIINSVNDEVIDKSLYINTETGIISDTINIVNKVQIYGGIIADPIGKGKTLSIISLIVYKYKNKYKFNISGKLSLINSKPTPTLIIVPKRLVLQWAHEFTKFVNFDVNIIAIKTIIDLKKISIDDYNKSLVTIIPSSLFETSLYNTYSKNIRSVIWERIIIDECHEIIIPKERTKKNLVYQHIIGFHSKYKWLLSGTPFGSTFGLNNNNNINALVHFLGNIYHISHTDTKLSYDDLLNNIYLYRRNDTSCIIIPDYTLKNIICDMTDMEKLVYNNIKNSGTNASTNSSTNASAIASANKYLTLQCNNIYMNSCLNKNIASDYTFDESNERSFEDMSLKEICSNMIKYYRSIIDDFNNKILLYEEQLSDINITEYTIIQPNGEFFCEKCIQFISNGKQYQCPITGLQIKPDELIQISSNRSCDSIESRWGTKFTQVYKYITNLTKGEKVLIFSQWNQSLEQLTLIFKFYKLKYTLCKGSIYQINNAILTFKSEPTCQIMLLSAETANSGFNLIEVSHIILLDTITSPSYDVIEKQAIGRAVRLGQKNNVQVVRFIIKDTIEYEIYISKDKNEVDNNDHNDHNEVDHTD